MSSLDQWQTYFDQAADAYTKAIYSGAIPTSKEREDSALQFRDWMEIFKDGGAASLPVLEAELENPRADRYNPATRLLIELRLPEPLRKLNEKVIQSRKPVLSYSNLRLLWLAVPPPSDLVKKWMEVWEILPVLRALLYQPSNEACSALDRILKFSDQRLTSFAVEASWRWIDKDLLQQIMHQPPLPSTLPGNFVSLVSKDNRSTAAFYLALTGDMEAVSFLESIPAGTDKQQAAYACHFLSLLALPNMLKPAETLLKSDDGDAVAMTLSAAANTGSAALIPALMDLSGKRVFSEIYGYNLADEAVRVLRELIGHPLDQLNEDYDIDSIPAEFTEAFRHQAIAIAQAALPNLNPSKRYRLGEPLTLSHLVEDLLSPHSGPRQNAAWNLHAITGEDHGFNLDDDLIDNVLAIAAWRKRAERPEPLSPGGWAFLGQPLPDPQL